MTISHDDTANCQPLLFCFFSNAATKPTMKEKQKARKKKEQKGTKKSFTSHSSPATPTLDHTSIIVEKYEGACITKGLQATTLLWLHGLAVLA